MRDKNFYIEFSIGSFARLDSLCLLFQAIKEEKELATETSEPDRSLCNSDDPKWVDYLDEEALAWFSDTFDFRSEEGRIYHQLWKLTAAKIRFTHPMFHPPGNWGFESLLDAIFNGEYALVDIDAESQTLGVLYYIPFSGPFGGSEALVGLIEAFGHQVLYDSWHNGPHNRRESAWDYNLAKELVSQGRGFRPSPLDEWS